MEYNRDFLYLTTSGWKSGHPHEIEIWFVEYDGAFFLISEKADDAHWVQNIRHNPAVEFWVRGVTSAGSARIIDVDKDSDLAQKVRQLMDEKYNWSSGLIVELAARH